ncbi:hypothetical protein, partial [Streptomyces albidoflavus]|uniref:hypothetical protein n=1 Tax=Streptomyces albidoflavus TaxID=1886 RepID=UPI003332CAEF
MPDESPWLPLADLPGVRAQLRDMAADITTGMNCLWLLPDRLVESGQAEDLYRRVLSSVPVFVDVPSPTKVGSEPCHSAVQDAISPVSSDAWKDGDQLPYLEYYDDGFDLGWEGHEHAPKFPQPRSEL